MKTVASSRFPDAIPVLGDFGEDVCEPCVVRLRGTIRRASFTALEPLPAPEPRPGQPHQIRLPHSAQR